MARGFNSSASILRNLADGTDINDIWSEFIAALELANQQRSAVMDLFTFRTTARAESVLQSPKGTAEFEEASEYGVPQSQRAEQAVEHMGFTFKWFDLATRYTWQYLAEASQSQVAALHNSAIEADNRLVFKTVLRRLFNPTQGANEDGTPVYGLWNGTDGKTPPDYEGNTFFAAHNHYQVSTGSTLAPADVETLVDNVFHHGYGDGDGQTLVVLANPSDAEDIASWRAGTGGATYDFIPSDDAPPFLTNETLVGQRPSGSYNGLKVIGQYGRALIVETYLMPVGYLVSVATGGSDSPRNPVALREHTTASLRGLQLVKGRDSDYPLIDSYYVHGLGTGVRNRGAAAVLQVAAGSTYTPPSDF